mmetsp:Transcript_15137/g.61949  ORF Transcript_15137/g.61949 Transcript_15137/m.61949 type:complete len:284 (-) Transcript_15137:1449-2300(-)|eukprot:CAMPEP_0113954080 /NCGR_PEP_ID=MMETSP0011_2-20120614/250_1 /TAXON_ID=101924 /ORGANISM="Rhodosorus marinus" /LENGTH=283 /DNA_ID=CAMNT_0000962961 /DNA_START=12 /DNA_END=863 /DNA_ORIENTATION=+ /assembly_acc=CAM_ASM_000156
MEKNYYSVLGVSPNATQKEISRAYRKAALRWHPDKNPGDERAAQMFENIYLAYEILSDEQLRKDVDIQRKVVAQDVERRQKMDVKRRKMRDDLETREKHAYEAEMQARKNKSTKYSEDGKYGLSEERRKRMKEEIEKLRRDLDFDLQRSQKPNKPVTEKREIFVSIKPRKGCSLDEEQISKLLKKYGTETTLTMTKAGALACLADETTLNKVLTDKTQWREAGLKVKAVGGTTQDDPEERKSPTNFEGPSAQNTFFTATDSTDFDVFEKETLELMSKGAKPKP